MNSRIRALSATLALVALTALRAQPQPPPPGGEEPRRGGTLAHPDTNGEGGRGEMLRGALLQDPDSNGDCLIDDTEARVAAERRVDAGRRLVDRLRQRRAENPNAPYPPLAAELDADRNWDISDAEAEAAVTRTMAELQKRNALVLKHFDTDQDGKLNETELATGKQAFAFMNEVRPERTELGERALDMRRDRFREGPPGRPGEGRDLRRPPDRAGAAPPPPAAAAEKVP